MSSIRASRHPCSAGATTATAIAAADGLATATAAAAAADSEAIAATVAGAAIETATVTVSAKNNGRPDPYQSATGSPAVLPAPQDLSVLRPERAEDRLQGCSPVAALHLGARQDRALAHHRGFGQEAA